MDACLHRRGRIRTEVPLAALCWHRSKRSAQPGQRLSCPRPRPSALAPACARLCIGTHLVLGPNIDGCHLIWQLQLRHVCRDHEDGTHARRSVASQPAQRSTAQRGTSARRSSSIHMARRQRGGQAKAPVRADALRHPKAEPSPRQDHAGTALNPQPGPFKFLFHTFTALYPPCGSRLLMSRTASCRVHDRVHDRVHGCVHDRVHGCVGLGGRVLAHKARAQLWGCSTVQDGRRASSPA